MIMAALTLQEALIFTFVAIFLVLWVVAYGYIAFVRHARREPPTPEAVATLRRELRRQVDADNEKREEARAFAAAHPKRCASPHAAPAKTPDVEAPPRSNSRGSVGYCLPTITEEGSCHPRAPSEELV